MDPELASRPSSAASTRRWRRLGLVAALTAAIILGGLWYRGGKPPPPQPPEVDLTDVDPEVAAALQEARAAVARDPRSAAAWGILGARFHACRYYPQALACYAEAERLDPGSADWPYLRAFILASGPGPARALRELGKAGERDARRLLPRIRRGELWLEQGGTDEAEGQSRAVLPINPAEPRCPLRLAQMAGSRQQWRE